MISHCIVWMVLEITIGGHYLRMGPITSLFGGICVVIISQSEPHYSSTKQTDYRMSVSKQCILGKYHTRIKSNMSALSPAISTNHGFTAFYRALIAYLLSCIEFYNVFMILVVYGGDVHGLCGIGLVPTTSL